MCMSVLAMACHLTYSKDFLALLLYFNRTKREFGTDKSRRKAVTQPQTSMYLSSTKDLYFQLCIQSAACDRFLCHFNSNFQFPRDL
jgi:hypothetical protein